MKYAYTLFLSVISLFVIAQPTVTSSWVPAAGLAYGSAYFDAQILDAGASGANVTWNFASIDTTATGGSRYINPTSGPSASLFPGATNCIMFTDSSDYEYYKLNGNVYQIVGAVSPDPSYPYHLSYSDPIDIIHFPMTYQSTFNDNGNFRQVVTGANPETLDARSSAVVTADGYGTLITKAGTFNNVLRLHMVQRELDSTYSTHSADSFHTDGYIWISATVPGVILASINHFNFGGSTQDEGYYSWVTATGIASLSSAGIPAWSVVPQPAHGMCAVIVQSTVSANADVLVHDMSGRLVSQRTAELSASRNEIWFDVSALADGLYTVSIISNGMMSSQKLVVRNQ